MFVILNIPSTEINEQINETAIRGGITKKNLEDVLKIIQQICGIYEEKENEKDIKFKNNTAKKIYEKVLRKVGSMENAYGAWKIESIEPYKGLDIEKR